MTHCLSQGYRNRKTNAVKLHRIYDYILFPYFAAQGIRYLLGYLHGCLITQQDRYIQRRRPDDRYSDDSARRTKYRIGQWLSGVNSPRSKRFRACLLRKVQVKRSLLYFPYLDHSFNFLTNPGGNHMLRELRRKCTQPVKRAGNYPASSSHATGIYRRELIKQPRQRRQWKTSLLKK